MNEKVMQVRIGITMVTALVLFAFLLLLFNKRVSFFADTKTVTIRFANAPGVALDTPVRKLGIRIGWVTGVDFSEDGRSVLVRAKLDSSKPVLRDDVCRINSGLLGDAVIEFVPKNDPRQPRALIMDNAVIDGEIQRDPIAVLEQLTDPNGPLIATTESVRKTSDQIGLLAANANNILGDNPQQFKEITENAASALKNISDAAEEINGILKDPKLREGLQGASEKLPQTLDSLIDTVGKIGGAAAEAKGAIADIRGITKSFNKSGPEVAKRVESSLSRLDSVLGEVQGIVESANDDASPIQQFLRDKDAYRDAKKSLDNLAAITTSVRGELDFWIPRLRYILDNTGEFTGKLGQRPSSILQGALQPRTGVTTPPSGKFR